MFRTIRISSCVSVQGEFVQVLSDGRMVIRIGETEFRGHPVAAQPVPLPVPAIGSSLR